MCLSKIEEMDETIIIAPEPMHYHTYGRPTHMRDPAHLVPRLLGRIQCPPGLARGQALVRVDDDGPHIVRCDFNALDVHLGKPIKTLIAAPLDPVRRPVEEDRHAAVGVVDGLASAGLGLEVPHALLRDLQGQRFQPRDAVGPRAHGEHHAARPEGAAVLCMYAWVV